MVVEQAPVADVLMGASCLELLERVRVLLTPRLQWTTFAKARNAYGRKVVPGSPDAVCWNVTGALAVVSNDRGIAPTQMLKFLDGMAAHMGLAQCLWPSEAEDIINQYSYAIWESIDDVNDRVRHEDILAFLDQVIDWVKQQEQQNS